MIVLIQCHRQGDLTCRVADELDRRLIEDRVAILDIYEAFVQIDVELEVLLDHGQ